MHIEPLMRAMVDPLKGIVEMVSKMGGALARDELENLAEITKDSLSKTQLQRIKLHKPLTLLRILLQVSSIALAGHASQTNLIKALTSAYTTSQETIRTRSTHESASMKKFEIKSEKGSDIFIERIKPLIADLKARYEFKYLAENIPDNRDPHTRALRFALSNLFIDIDNVIERKQFAKIDGRFWEKVESIMGCARDLDDVIIPEAVEREVFGISMKDYMTTPKYRNHQKTLFAIYEDAVFKELQSVVEDSKVLQMFEFLDNSDVAPPARVAEAVAYIKENGDAYKKMVRHVHPDSV